MGMTGTRQADGWKSRAMAALTAADYNVTLAAERLGISRSTFYRWLRRWGLVPSPQGDTERHVPAERDVPQSEGPKSGRDVQSRNADKDSIAVSQTVEPQELLLTELRAERKLAGNEMGTEAAQVESRRRGRPRGGRILSDDRWHSLAQAAIDLSFLTRIAMTAEEVLALLVDTKLPELLVEASRKREESK